MEHSARSCKRCITVASWPALWTLACTFFTICVRFADGFEVFAEQQILTLNDLSKAPLIDYNNSDYGSTHIDDYWAKLDINYSPIDGWSLYRHVRLGCFIIKWQNGPPGGYLTRTGVGLTSLQCVQFCNRSQSFYQFRTAPVESTCRCETIPDSIPYETVASSFCPSQSWEIFREYDYRSSMSPSAYDVARRLVYQIVTMRLPHLTPQLRHYLHAVNALEALPKFEYDTPLDRMVFNAVWDFGKSRMVSLSFKDWETALDFSVITFNSSTGALIVKQEHVPVQPFITAVGNLLDVTNSQGVTIASESFASTDGLGSVDILYGTYYTVVPAKQPGGNQVVHVIVAIDIENQIVLNSVTLPVTLMNLQINALTHVLYGAGADTFGRVAYYELCKATNQTIIIGTTPQRSIVVKCDAIELSPLPNYVNFMYLQSAAIDHTYNYAWFTYKEKGIGRPLIMEVHQNDVLPTNPFLPWRQDSLPLEAGYTSLIQTAPRIIFSLYPPLIRSAKFASSGTIIYVEFNAPTLQGAIPIDTNGDEIPDYYNPADMVTGRVSCDRFFDSYTVQLIQGSMCQWTTSSTIYLELSPSATILPGQLVRIRPNRVYAGKITASGVYLFSQPSTDFAVVQLPDIIPTPVVKMSGNWYLDSCTELVLDASSSIGHGFRGTFNWALNVTIPPSSEPHVRQIEKIMRDLQPVGQSPQVKRIPANVLHGGTKYYFKLVIVSFWNPKMVAEAIRLVTVSATPVPPLVIYGPQSSQVQTYNALSLASKMDESTGCATVTNPIVTYTWIGCNTTKAVPMLGSQLGCLRWDQDLFPSATKANITGMGSRTLYIKPWTLQPLMKYMFTVEANMTINVGTVQQQTLTNMQSIVVEVTLGPMYASFRGGTNGLTVARNLPVVIDSRASIDPSDPTNLYGKMVYNYTCREKVATTGQGPACFPGWNGTLPYVPCVNVTNNATGQITSFSFNGALYNHAKYVTTPQTTQLHRYCMQEEGAILIIQHSYLTLNKEFVINLNVSKVVQGNLRYKSAEMVVSIVEAQNPLFGPRRPFVHVDMLSSQPFVTNQALRFTGQVTNPAPETAYTYAWTIYFWGPNPNYDIDLATTQAATYNVKPITWVPVAPSVINFTNPQNIRSSPGSRFLVTVPNLFNPGVQYTIRLTATNTVLLAQSASDAQGWAEVRFVMGGNPPSGGTMTTNNLTGVAFQTRFRLTLSGWGSQDMPVSYQFGYKADPSDTLTQATLLTSSYSAQREIITVLPPGKLMPNNRLEVIGWVRSIVGAVQSKTLTLSVSPNPNWGSVVPMLLSNSANLEPESAMANGIMLAQSCAPNCPQLQQLLDNFEKVIVNATAGQMPLTPQVANTQSTFLEVLSVKGLKTGQMITNIDRVVNLSIRENYVSIADAYTTTNAPKNVQGLLSMTDSMIPDASAPPPSGLAGIRRMQDFYSGHGLYDGYGRRLQTQQAIDYRSSQQKYTQLAQLKTFERRVGNVMVQQLAVGESPANFTLRGHDYACGKEDVKAPVPMVSTFRVPSLDRSSGPQVFSYFFIEYKKFPYGFIPRPPNRTLYAPTASSGALAKRIPSQGFTLGAATWHAMSLELGDLTGASIDTQVQASLTNATFSLLPMIQAHHSKTPPIQIDKAATCYQVVMGQTVADAKFDQRGVVYNDNSCVSTKVTDYVVLVDNLAADLSFVESYSSEKWDDYIDEYKTMAMVSSLVITFLVALVSAAAAIYCDESQHNVAPIDLSKARVIDLPDPREKIIETISFTFRRNHLLVGMGMRHHKLTREKRVWTILTAWLSVEAFATLFHTKIEFRGQEGFVWIATGLVAGVLSFPLMQLVQFLYEWRPESKIRSTAPPTSTKPLPLPRKLQAQMPVIKQPARPPVPTVVLPPPASAPPRMQLSLPVIPPGLPALQLGDRQKPPAPPPPMPKRGPRPPNDPPPAAHLTAGDSRSIKAYGLTMPELPKLMPPTSMMLPGGGVPPPPSKPAGGPRPPKAPPPPKRAIPVKPPSTLPALPSLKRPTDLGKIRLAGADSSRKFPAPPPPPPPKAPPPPQHPHLDAIGPQAPPTPRSGDGDAAQPMLAASPPPVPGVPELEASSDDSESPRPPPSPPSSAGGPLSSVSADRTTSPVTARQFRQAQAHGAPPQPPAAPSRIDVEARAPEITTFSPDPEHTMMPDGDATPPGSLAGTLLPGELNQFNMTTLSQLSDSFGPNDLRRAGNVPAPPQRPPPTRPPPGKAQPNLPSLPANTGRGGLGPRPVPWKVGMPPPPPPIGAPPSSSGAGANVPTPPPPPVAGQVDFPLFKLGPRTRQPTLPPLPKMPLPLTAQMTPNVKPHPPNMPPPPPPPRMNERIRRDEMPAPPEEDEPVIIRRLAKFKGDASRQGKPPPKPPPKRQMLFAPKPPSGAPPANAYILAKKDASQTGVMDDDLLKKVPKAPPIVPPAPPPGAPPPGHLRTLVPEAPQLSDLLNKPPEAKPAFGENLLRKPKDPWPVPDWVVFLTNSLVNIFVLGMVVECCIFILFFGSYMTPGDVWATHGATLVGFIVNCAFFESVKCFVVAAVALAQDANAKRQSDLAARRARMALKAQRLQDKSRRWRKDVTLPSLPPPPLMG